jgi:hypothetical protein
MNSHNIADKLESFLSDYNELNKIYDIELQKLSDIDKKLSIFYHKVEGVKINHISESHNMIKELKEILAIRRESKLNTRLLLSFNQTLEPKMKQFKDSKNKMQTIHLKLLKDLEINANK